MAELSDPALELAALCDRLNLAHQTRGDQFLASTFEVDPWSPEFFQILGSITTRTVALSRLLKSIGANEAVLTGAENHLTQIRGAFSHAGLSNHWKNHGQRCVSAEHSSPIRMLSPAIPSEYSFPNLTPEEVTELLGLTQTLLEWLKEAQLGERDFIRESLIEGLENFRFRLERLDWFGWGYSIESLREVILAYLTLERGIDMNANPEIGALLKRTGKLLKAVFGHAERAKGAWETGDWLLSAYSQAMRVGGGPVAGYIAGYLTQT
ncbi:hypothetical protein K3177_10035 [Qipengyuania sp. GH25]|uniref:Uncharacterized protein n=1 Tax=Qipengyuania pacifica TaxID=2860199 RepID=A0ABS7JJQ0_9SPHN|nr:hypothetical protein [Qipengyuania aerophila]MBX7488852.1 hypothetical protein [Qipengyuania aerophila]